MVIVVNLILQSLLLAGMFIFAPDLLGSWQQFLAAFVLLGLSVLLTRERNVGDRGTGTVLLMLAGVFFIGYGAWSLIAGQDAMFPGELKNISGLSDTQFTVKSVLTIVGGVMALIVARMRLRF